MAIFLLTRREAGLGWWGMRWRRLPSPIASRLNKVEGLEVDMVAL
ncbi:MAG: hypothetical protein SXA11_19240 [Cyanobacteriota bacterium]|nr:hypothetical protein [Cyanobacteriota bacterium]